MQDGSILAGVQMPPFSLRLMIVERSQRTAYGTNPLPIVLMGEVDVHFSLLHFQFHALHLPRRFDTQNASIQFMILHSVIFAWLRCISQNRSEEHTSELQSHSDLVCRLLLEKKKKKHNRKTAIH